MIRGRVGLRCWPGADEERCAEVRRALESESWLVGQGDEADEATVWVFPILPGPLPIDALSGDRPVIAIVLGDDPVRWLEAGAGDALAFPVRPRELSARLQAALRRSHINRIIVGPITIDLMNQEVRSDDGALLLTRLETAYVCYLAARPGKWTTGTELRKSVNGSQHGNLSSPRVHVSRIRKKLGAWAGILETRKGFGYRLLDESPQVLTISSRHG